ncbi:TPA: phage tail protein [Yersinia enterocolitica]|nr:phage tail protein [Yersinia enterocolitica]HDL7209083.1 phage tail protein [Yersinia enterocolitica]HDL7213312.1 phage tail protein [Yersinia enterocolitica]
MTTKFFAILTHLGAAKLANATALGTQLQITHMAVGDGGGVLPLPNAAQTQLVGEKRRAALNSLSVDAANSSQIIAEQVIPETDGGWWIREVGLFDKDGVLIAIANCPETYKPQLQEGSGRTQTVRMVLIVSSTEAVTLKIDPSVVLATRKYVDDQVIEVKAYADGLMAAHLAAADPHSQYAPKASPALTGKPTAPTAAKTDNSTQLATTAHVKQVVTDYAPLASPALTGKPTAPTAAKTDNSTQLATTAHVKQVVADYAPIASPTLTGTPTTPTAAAGNSTQQLANTAFVQAAIAALVASSPAALDTLKELADALGNDPNFATTMTNALAGKMDKAKNGGDIPNVATFLANLGLTDIGIGLPNMSDIANFDWQNFPFRSGANYTTNYNTWVNPPDGVTYNAGTRVGIRVTYISNLASGPRMGLELTPDTGAATNFKVYRLLCVGAAGSRVFTFNQDWNSANPVPVSGGGFGGATVEAAFANLGLGDAAKKGVASNAEMQVGTADKLVSLVGLMSVFGKRVFGTSDYFRFPDVPGGFIFQFGTATTLASGDVIVTFPIPFPNKVLGIHPSQNNSYTNGAWAAYASKSLSSFALSGWTNATTRIAIGVDYFAIGY